MTTLQTLYLTPLMMNDYDAWYRSHYNLPGNLEDKQRIGRWGVANNIIKQQDLNGYNELIHRWQPPYENNNITIKQMLASRDKAIQQLIKEIKKQKYSIAITAKYQTTPFESWINDTPELQDMLTYRSSIDAVNMNNESKGAQLRVYLFERKE